MVESVSNERARDMVGSACPMRRGLATSYTYFFYCIIDGTWGACYIIDGDGESLKVFRSHNLDKCRTDVGTVFGRRLLMQRATMSACLQRAKRQYRLPRL